MLGLSLIGLGHTNSIVIMIKKISSNFFIVLFTFPYYRLFLTLQLTLYKWPQVSYIRNNSFIKKKLGKIFRKLTEKGSNN